MVVLKLSEHEAGVLKAVLSEALDEIRGEIVRTEDWELKESLKSNRQVIEHLSLEIDRLLATSQTA